MTPPRLALHKSLPHWRATSVAAIVVAVVVTAVPAILIGTTGAGVAAGSQITGSVAAPSASEVSPICDAPDPQSVLGPAPTLPSNPTSTLISPPGGVVDFTATSSDLYVNTGSQLITYTLSGTKVGAFSIPSSDFNGGAEPTQPVINSSGDIYIGSYYGQVVDEFSPSGTLMWSVDPASGHPVGLFPIGSGSTFSVGVSLVEDTGQSEELSATNGSDVGTFPLYDDFGYVTQESNGDYLFTETASSTTDTNDIGYVETVSPTGTVLASFGSSHIEGNDTHTGSGTQFYYPGQAAAGPNGTIYTADPLSTIEATSPNGYLQGQTTLGSTLNMGSASFYLEGQTFFFQGGPPFDNGSDNISVVSLTDVEDYLSAVQVPDDSLGWGAGLSTPEVGNYFAPGETAAVDANFEPWWSEDASHLDLDYSIENQSTLTNETVPAPTDLALPTSASALSSVPLAVPTTDQTPGPYLVQASLYDTSTDPPTLLGSTCLPYTVGASGDQLNLAGLPAGAGSGGPADPRGVALNAELGLNGLRALSFSWSNFLPNCNSGAPTAATCGPTAMTFSSAPDSYFQAAATAEADHVTYWVQVSGGDTTSMALVNNGWWEGDIQKLVGYYAKVPAGCSPCAPVTNWEPWNESNNTGWSNAADYVSKVLAPFYTAVKAVEPGATSTVIGGSTLEPSIGWWQNLVTAGGLADMDVAAIHPYTGNNDSFEEDGMQTQVQQLQAVLGSKPLWFTEVGWWSDGDYNYLDQADTVARAMIWMKVLDIPVWNYFFDEGSWGNDGVSFSLIQATSSDDYVKPAALATMVASNQLAGRPSTGTPQTGIPQTYEATFGPSGNGSTDLAATWSDGLAVTGSVTVTAPGGGTVPVTVVDEYGNATSVSANSGQAYSLPISNPVTYLLYPAGDTLSIGPTESYGANLALSTAGAIATATSGDATDAIVGLPLGYGNGWYSASGDATPSLTVTLPTAASINRIVVDTQSNGSTAPSLRDFVVSVDEPGTGWQTISTVTGAYRFHQLQLAFAPVVATGVRLSVSEVNFGGYYGGGIPPWWDPTDTEGATVHALQVYAGSESVADVDGDNLTPLVTGGGGGGGTTTTTTTTTSTTTTTTTSTEPSSTTTTTTTKPGGSGHHGGVQEGYWLATSSGTTFAFGNHKTLGPNRTLSLTRPVVGMAAGKGAKGYWLVGEDGGVFPFGNAHLYGSAVHDHVANTVVGMAATPDDKGYWLVTSSGTVYPFGNAHPEALTGSHQVQGSIVGMAATPDGKGYWLVNADGAVYPFGDAIYKGSAGTLPLNAPIVGIAPTTNGRGYWLVASDGDVLNFGDAPFKGSGTSLTLGAPAIGLAPTPDDRGYWLATGNGDIYPFGDAIFKGSAGESGVGRSVVAIW
jgi:hypothetical protein